MKVPLHYVNEAVAPAVKLGGALVSHIVNELDISCLPRDLPEFIEVDLSSIEVGKSVHVSEIKLPAGVTAITHGKDPVLATAVVPKAHAETEEAAAATAEPGAAAPAAPAADKGGEKKEAAKEEKKK
jgi:large subunit ribosomal protein L25